RRIARAHRMILVRDRRAEQRHDAVAHHLVHGALVVVDGLHHVFENGIEKLPRLLGIAIGEQLHRPLEIGEEYRDLLSLALERGLRRQDLLGEVLRSIGLGIREAWLSGLIERCRTLATELVSSRVSRSARRARGPEQRRALAAESCSGRVLSLA